MCMVCSQAGIVALEHASRGKEIPEALAISALIDAEIDRERKQAQKHFKEMKEMRLIAVDLDPSVVEEIRTVLAEYTPEYWRDFLNRELAIFHVLASYGITESGRARDIAKEIVDNGLELREMSRRAVVGIAPLAVYMPEVPPEGEQGAFQHSRSMLH